MIIPEIMTIHKPSGACCAGAGEIMGIPTTMRLDAIDVRILSVIQRQGRITKLALADSVGLSATPCWTRLKRLEDAGVISRYEARIDTRVLPSFATVLVEITLGLHRQADFDRFERAVREAPEVTACWSVGGGVDYILKIVTRDVDSYQRLIDTWLEREIGITRYFTYIVTRTIKETLEVPEALLVVKPG